MRINSRFWGTHYAPTVSNTWLDITHCNIHNKAFLPTLFVSQCWALNTFYTIINYSQVPDRSTQILIERKKKYIKHTGWDCPKSFLLVWEKSCLMQWRSRSVDVNHQSLYIKPKLRAAVCRLSSGDSPETVCIYFRESYLSNPELLPCRG